MGPRCLLAAVALLGINPALGAILVDYANGIQARDLVARDEAAKQGTQVDQTGQTPNAQDLQAMWESQAQDMAKAGKAAPNAQQLQALEQDQQAQAAKQGQQAPTAEQLHQVQQIGQADAQEQAHAEEALKQAIQANGDKQDLPFGLGSFFGGGGSGAGARAMAGGGSGFGDILKNLPMPMAAGGGGGSGGGMSSPFNLGGIFKNPPMPMASGGGSGGGSSSPFDVGGIFKGLFPNGIDLSKLPQPMASNNDDCPTWWPYCPKKDDDDCPAWLPKWYCPKKPDDCPYPWAPWYCPKKQEKSWYGYDCPDDKPKCPSCYGGWNGEKFVCFYFWVAGCECEY